MISLRFYVPYEPFLIYKNSVKFYQSCQHKIDWQKTEQMLLAYLISST